MPTARNFSSIAVSTTLASAYLATDTTITVSSATGFPAVPFTIVVGKDTSTQELMEVTATAGTTWTVTRGIDGTSATAQPQFATVRMAASARDFSDANAHVVASTAVHGLAAGVAVVGDTATQTLTNKTPCVGWPWTVLRGTACLAPAPHPLWGLRKPQQQAAVH